MNTKIYKKGLIASTGIILLAGLTYFSFEMYRTMQKETPHYVDGGCGVCHIIENEITLVGLKANEELLCTSCHSREGDIEIENELGTLIKVDLGISHPYGMEPSEKSIPTTLPLFDGKIKCSTCHDVHTDNSESNMLRLYTAQEGQNADFTLLCLDCHKEY